MIRRWRWKRLRNAEDRSGKSQEEKNRDQLLNHKQAETDHDFAREAAGLGEVAESEGMGLELIA